MQDQYRLGQILYVVLKKEAKVYPMQVVEIASKRTLDGEVTTYMVRGGPTTDKYIALNDVDGEIFDAAETLQRTLIERATNGITERVSMAVAKAHEWYPNGFESATDELTVIRKTPQLASKPTAKATKKQNVPEPVAELASELAAEADNLTHDNLVQLPDGTMAKVRSLKLPDTMQG